MAERRTLPQLKDAAARLAFAGTPASQRDPCSLAVVHSQVQAAYDLGESDGKGSEHVVQLTPVDAVRLARWLERPNGAFSAGQVTFEAVAGGILVRARPWRAP
jgi:type II secretory pathway component PulM